MRSALGMRSIVPPPTSSGSMAHYAPGSLAAVIGREFLVPNDPNKTGDDLLRAAVDIASAGNFQRKRAAYWRWQREFLNECTVLDRNALDEAVEEMRELIEEEKAEVRKPKVKLGLSFAFATGAAAIGLFRPPLAPLAVAGGFLSIGACTRIFRWSEQAAEAVSYVSQCPTRIRMEVGVWFQIGAVHRLDFRA
jgi:hypothetical protein